MRTQGILLIKDAVFVMTRCSTDGGSSHLIVARADHRYFATGAKTGQWEQICTELVTRLDEYSGVLLRNARSFLEVGDKGGIEIIQSTCVGCLAHLAVLCDLVGRVGPNSKPQMDAICDSSLERLGHLTLGLNFDDYTYFDLILGVRQS